MGQLFNLKHFRMADMSSSSNERCPLEVKFGLLVFYYLIQHFYLVENLALIIISKLHTSKRCLNYTEFLSFKSWLTE